MFNNLYFIKYIYEDRDYTFIKYTKYVFKFNVESRNKISWILEPIVLFKLNFPAFLNIPSTLYENFSIFYENFSIFNKSSSVFYRNYSNLFKKASIFQ